MACGLLLSLLAPRLRIAVGTLPGLWGCWGPGGVPTAAEGCPSQMPRETSYPGDLHYRIQETKESRG
ncbi:Alpha-Mannosidase 2 [Manis pentadactyla]|nr:Alpha-Mannosidase 2 [Manis pentadactyla]